MPVNGMSVGRDYSFSYYDVLTNSIIDLGDIIDVDIKANKHDLKSARYNDVPRFGYVPDGYDISFSLVRVNVAAEAFQLAYNTNFNAGGNCPGGFLNEVVRNPDGTTSSFQYTGFVFFLTDVANISRDKNVTSKGVGKAGDKKQVS